MSEKSYTKYLGTVLDDRYQILEKIGEGGMAIVFRALDTRLNREVAVKIVRDELFGDEEISRQFFAEAHAVAKLSHPGIVAIYDVSQTEDLSYLVMELLSGITLRQYMERKHPVPWKQVLHFSRQIADALQHAHERGIIHRDIKPQNIMLLPNGSIKVADFGIAAFQHELNETKGEALGSLHYIAPEQLRGKKADARGDVYSLGVSMYEMLTGYKPYTGETPMEILQQQKSGSLLPVRAFDVDVPEEFENIVMKAMAVDPAERYQSSQELKTALNRFTDKVVKAENRARNGLGEQEGGPLKVSVTPTVNIPKWEYVRSMRRSNRIGFSTGSFALLAVMVMMFVFLWNFWLRDVFTEAQRVELPNFVGSSYDTISHDVSLTSRYKFTVTEVVDTSTPAGTVLAQDPVAGRSLMLTDEGMPVRLSVSTGYVLSEVPNVVGSDYREATRVLQNAGFVVEISNQTSQTVAKDLVISSSPSAGESISAGSTVYLTVSSGVQISYVRMPNLVGLSEDAAIEKLRNANLTYGGSERITSVYDAGTVISQSVVAFAEVEELTNVTLTVSSGGAGGIFY